MIQIIFATNPLFFSSLRQTPKFNHIEGLIVGMLTLTLFGVFARCGYKGGAGDAVHPKHFGLGVRFYFKK